MTFKFLAKNPESQITTVRVRAQREIEAREKLVALGYKPVAMTGVEASGTPDITFHRQGTSQVRKPLCSVPSRKLVFKLRFTSLVSDFLAPFSLFG